MPRGFGSIFLRGKTWYIQFWRDGRQYQQSSGSGDRAEAERQLAQILADDRPPGAVTVGSLLDAVLADYETRELRNRYIARKVVEKHLRRPFGSLAIRKLTRGRIDAYIRDRRKQGAANATINRELALIRRALTLGRQAGLIRLDLHIPRLVEENVRQGFLTHDQYLKLKAQLPSHLQALFVVAYHVGGRRGELLKLRRDMVDLDAGVIRIEAKNAKTKKPRTLPIYGDMRAYLEMAIAAGDGGCPWLWQIEGRRVKEFRAAWKAAIEAAGLPGLLFHDLRRTAVRNLERAGVPRAVAMSITGHKTESVYRRYDIVSEEDLRDAGRRLEAWRERTTAEPLQADEGTGWSRSAKSLN
jgi:integrase